ncbi:MAG TPA: VOC family protein [Pyrinomonadaceae bacterium]|jgi:predicted enzyme related to lactoylglutathione lyase|nr:VOC family protein [Pyrinomonadaceae bacterium]
MAEHQIPAHGQFCWSELATTNADAAKNFYSELFGWKFKQGDVPGMSYSEIMAGGEKPVGGLYQMGAECGWGDNVAPHWMSYVAVDDVDASAQRVVELGGKICVPPTDIPNVGRFSVITDPTGANISIVTLSGAHS